MGSETSKEEKQEKSILCHPQQGQASDFYWACRAGDLDSVRKLIASNPFTDLNHLEPNGSTALHAASYFGHTEIVRLLLHQHGVMRHRRNRHGVTAYEEAANDEIRHFFHRPANSPRFCSDNTDDAHQLFTSNGDEEAGDDEDDNDQAPDDWVKGTFLEDDVCSNRVSFNRAKTLASSAILRLLLKASLRDKKVPDRVRNEDTAVKALQRFIDKHVTPSHSQYKKASELVSKYAKTKNVEHLLRLYSLDTPFYKNLGCEAQSRMLTSSTFVQVGPFANPCVSGPLFPQFDHDSKRSSSISMGFQTQRKHPDKKKLLFHID